MWEGGGEGIGKGGGGERMENKKTKVLDDSKENLSSPGGKLSLQ